MIFDYLIDFKYLKDVLGRLEAGDPALENFKRIIDSCVLPEENGRLVLDSDRKILRGMRTLEFPMSKFGQRNRYILEDRFLKSLPAGRFDRRQMIGVSGNNEKICVRDVPIFNENNIERIIDKLSSVDPAPSILVTDNTDREGRNDIPCIDLSSDEVFDAVDRVRGQLKLEQGVSCGDRVSCGDNDNEIALKDFWSWLHVFGSVEETGFSIYDPYCFDTSRSKCKTLMRWIVHLVGGVNICRTHIKVGIYSKCEKNDYVDGIPHKVVDLLGELKRTVYTEDNILHLKNVSIELKFMFAINDCEDRKSRRFMRILHDRYICSSTHYFGIGSGIDSIGNRETFNVQYKGRITRGRLPSQINALSEFYSDPENLASGRIRTFTCQI